LPGRPAEGNAVKNVDPHVGVLVRMVGVSPADRGVHREQHAILGPAAMSMLNAD